MRRIHELGIDLSGPTQIYWLAVLPPRWALSLRCVTEPNGFSERYRDADEGWGSLTPALLPTPNKTKHFHFRTKGANAVKLGGGTRCWRSFHFK